MIMKINKKLYLKMVFYIAGTALALMLFTAVGINFAADSSLFEKPLLVSENVIDSTEEYQNGNGEEVAGTLYYNRRIDDSAAAKTTAAPASPSLSASASASASSSAKSSASGRTSYVSFASPRVSPSQSDEIETEETDAVSSPAATSPGAAVIVKPQDVKIEIVNYSGVEEAALEIRDMLAAEGYSNTVIRREDFTAVIGVTTIIDRSSGDLGEKIQDLLFEGKEETGRIENGNGSSDYTITIIIGEDVLPEKD
ncbi:MAG: LytR C-terminal domain-containing protein [Eubacteriales bacterium]|nr:LytR C-terminal domain-containing protein [Eubacteriales bacterium]